MGVLGVLAGVGILSFYCVIAGWTVAYVWFTVTGQVSGDQQAIGEFFAEFTANAPLSVSLAFLVLAVTAGVLLGGVRSGIERVTKTLMPALIGLLVLLAGRALTLPGAAEGLAYYLRPDLSSFLDISVYNAALGQAFFSLSLGMGAMLTYGSYLDKGAGIAGAAVWVVALDTLVALLAGFIIFPSGFSIPGFDPSSSGPGLIFTVLPRLFSTLPGRQPLRRGVFCPARNGGAHLYDLLARGPGSSLCRRAWLVAQTCRADGHARRLHPWLSPRP